MDTQEQDLCSPFIHHSYNLVSKIKMMRDFAFVHFNDRQQAERAMRALNGKAHSVFINISIRLLLTTIYISMSRWHFKWIEDRSELG